MGERFLADAAFGAEPAHVASQDVAQGSFVRPFHGRNSCGLTLLRRPLLSYIRPVLPTFALLADARWHNPIWGQCMRFRSRLAVAPIIGLFAAGCIHTQELPLAPNVVRLDTQASGLLFAGQATTQTMRRAAELTLQNGYTHFRFEQAELAQGSQLAGVYGVADLLAETP